MGRFNVSMTLTGPETGRSETMDAVVDREVIHSIIPSDTLARLGIEPDGRSSVIDLPRGDAYLLLHAQIDDSLNPHLRDYPAPITVLFGSDGCQPIVGRTALSALNLTVDPERDRLIPVEIRIPGDLMVHLLKEQGMLKDNEASDGNV